MSGKKILVCPPSASVVDGVLTLPTTWDGDEFTLIDPYITIVSPQVFTLAVQNATKNWNGQIEYSTNGNAWSIWDGTTTLTAASGGEDYRLYMRGRNNSILSGAEQKRWVFTGNDISIKGDIGWLLDYKTVENFTEAVMANYCCAYLFYGNTNLVKAPSLVYGTASDYCYNHMFENCTGISEASSLPRTGLASGACAYMYYGCTSLVHGVDMEYASLPDNCCSYMYYGCSSLVSAPLLSATSIGSGCYWGMFENCISLTTAPELPSTSLNLSCYIEMFAGCKSLLYPPALPARYLTYQCYTDMFRGSGIVTAPVMNVWQGENFAMGRMFSGCTDLVTAPNLGDIGYDSCCYQMFSGCTSLLKVPSMRIKPKSNITAHSACYEMFKGCTSITFGENSRIVVEGARSVIDNSCFYSMFEGCTNLSNPVVNFPIWNSCTIYSRAFSRMFYGCSSLERTIDLPNNITCVEDSNPSYTFSYMYGDCTSLTTTSALRISSLSTGSCKGMFSGCASILETPEFPNVSTIPDGAYANMFYRCTSLNKAHAIKGTTIGLEGCSFMFYGCTSLVSPPMLPNAFVDGLSYQGGYRGMFNGCTSLEVLPGWLVPRNQIFKDYCYQEMFVGCSKIKMSLTQDATYKNEFRIPAEGTMSVGTYTNQAANMFSRTGGSFTGTPEMNTTYYTSNLVKSVVEAQKYLSFSCSQPFRLSNLSNSSGHPVVKYWDGVIEYYNDNGEWVEWDGRQINAIETSDGYVLGLRGTNNTKIIDIDNRSYFNFYCAYSNLNIKIKGNIECLLDYPTVDAGNHPNMAKGCYCHWLYGSAHKKFDISELQLPATELAPNCYFFMFAYNTLVGMVELPATTLAEFCYESMFIGCSLERAPELRATTMALYCYSGMFQQSNIVTPPSLPSVDLAIGCYQEMFRECDSLNALPALPASTLPAQCYALMFYHCDNIHVSNTQGGTYTKAYRIPSGGGTASFGTDSTQWMFTGATIGPTQNTIYTSNSIVT